VVDETNENKTGVMGLNVDYLKFKDQSFLNIHTKWIFTEKIEFSTSDFYQEYHQFFVTENNIIKKKQCSGYSFKEFENAQIILSTGLPLDVYWIDLFIHIESVNKVVVEKVRLYFKHHFFESERKNKFKISF
jgi:hypothetical protein